MPMPPTGRWSGPSGCSQNVPSRSIMAPSISAPIPIRASATNCSATSGLTPAATSHPTHIEDTMTGLPTRLVIAAASLALLMAGPAEAAKRKSRTQAASKHYVRTVDTQPVRSDSVYYGAKYHGADPDPRIRHELLRDLGAAFGGQD